METPSPAASSRNLAADKGSLEISAPNGLLHILHMIQDRLRLIATPVAPLFVEASDTRG